MIKRYRIEEHGRAVIVAGNLSEGFTFIGPFKNVDEAEAYCEAEFSADCTESTWIADLNPPYKASRKKKCQNPRRMTMSEEET